MSRGQFECISSRSFPALRALALSALTLPAVSAQQELASPLRNGNAPSAARSFEISGRCVDAENGQGLARCEVALTGHMATGYPLNWGVPEFIDPDPIVTRADGTFRFRITAPHGWDAGAGYSPRFHLSVSHALRPGWFGHMTFTDLVKSGELVIGDVTLVPARRPVIRVLDSDGKPQEGVAIDLKFEGSDLSTPRAGILSETRVFRLRSDQSGTLALKSALRPGTWSLSCKNRTIVGANEPLIISPDAETVVRHLVTVGALEGSQSVAGCIVNSDRNPEGGQTLGLICAGQFEPSLMVRSNENGKFRFQGLTEKEIAGPLALVLVLNNRYDGYPKIDLVAAGTSDVSLTLPALRSFRLVVQDEKGGVVPNFSVHARPVGQEFGLSPTRIAGRFVDGSVQVALRQGAWEFAVIAEDRTLVPSDWIALNPESLDRGQDQRVKLVRRILKPIRVHGPGGGPIVGITVRVMDGSGVVNQKAHHTTAGGVVASRQGNLRGVALYEAETGEAGEAIVAGPDRQGLPARIIVERSGKVVTSVAVAAWDEKPLTISVEK